jgi:hypothetical protein
MRPEKGLAKSFERIAVTERLRRGRLDDRERILHSVAELGDEHFAMPLGLLSLGRIV